MSRDKILGAFLALVSLVVAVLAGIYFALIGGAVPLTAFAWPALGFILGVVIFFFSFVQVGLRLDDEIEEFPDLVEDDIRHFRSGTFTNTHFMAAVTLIAALVQVVLLLWYEKIYASWGPFNVMFVALVAIVLALLFSFRSQWFQFRSRRLPARVFWIPAVGWLICISLGIWYAEPLGYASRSQMERTQAVAVEGAPVSSPGLGRVAFWRTADIMANSVSFDCDDEGCLVLLLIGIVVVSVIASATIPHFWVVATMLLLTLMGVITLREILVREKVP